MTLPFDYCRCRPKWSFAYCKDCLRNVDNTKEWPEWRPMSVADYSTDNKGDKKDECKDKILEE